MRLKKSARAVLVGCVWICFKFHCYFLSSEGKQGNCSSCDWLEFLRLTRDNVHTNPFRMPYKIDDLQQGLPLENSLLGRSKISSIDSLIGSPQTAELCNDVLGIYVYTHKRGVRSLLRCLGRLEIIMHVVESPPNCQGEMSINQAKIAHLEQSIIVRAGQQRPFELPYSNRGKSNALKYGVF